MGTAASHAAGYDAIALSQGVAFNNGSGVAYDWAGADSTNSGPDVARDSASGCFHFISTLRVSPGKPACRASAAVAHHTTNGLAS